MSLGKSWSAAGGSADLGHRMTSSAFSLFLVLLAPSITAANQTGLKLRITDKAQDVLKDLGLLYLDELEHSPFSEFSIPYKLGRVKITGLTLTSLKVKPANVVLAFRDKSSVLFEVRKLAFTGKLHRRIMGRLFGYEFSIDSRTMIFGASGVYATIGVTLNRNYQGHLSVGITHCKITTEHIMIDHSGIMGFFWNLFKSLYRKWFNNQLCPVIQNDVVHHLNSELEKITKPIKLNVLNTKLYIDESLSGSIAVTPHCLDVPFRGLVYRPGQTARTTPGSEPILRETQLMAYLGVSESVFNSAGMSLYSSGPFHLTIPESDKVTNKVLEAVGLPKGDVQVQLSKPPTAIISEKGLSVTVAARAQSLVKPAPPAVPVSCQIDVKVVLKGSHLFLLAESTKCKSKPKTLKGILASGLFNIGLQKKIKGLLENLFDKGLPIPLPEGVGFTKGTIQYHRGFLVVGGDLSMTRAGKLKVVKILGR